VVLIGHGGKANSADDSVAALRATIGGAHTLVVDFIDDPRAIDVPGAQVVSRDDRRWVLAFDRRLTTANDLIARVSAAGTVADISLNGALLELPQDLTIQSGDDVRLELIHPQTKKLALADAVVVHTKAGHAGCRFTEIDPESIERLRELLLWLVTEES